MLYFIVVFLLVYAFGSPKTSTNSTICPKMHKWIYENEGTEEEYMVCSVCKRRPGDAINDGSVL